MKSQSWGVPDNLDLTQEESDYWEEKVGCQTMETIGWFLKAVKISHPELACSVGKVYISIVPFGEERQTDFIVYPQKKAIIFAARVPESESVNAAFMAQGASPMPFDVSAKRVRYSVPLEKVRSAELENLLMELLDNIYINQRNGNANPLSGEVDKNQQFANDAKTPNATEQSRMKPVSKDRIEMRLTNVVQEWLTEMEWEEKPEYDEENKKSSTTFDYRIEDFNLKCYVDADEAKETFKLYMYYLETKAPEKRLEEVKQLVYLVNNNVLALGQINLLESERVIRYYNALDVENASFEPAHITNMFNAGLGGMHGVIPKYMTVCFGGKSATDAMSADV